MNIPHTELPGNAKRFHPENIQPHTESPLKGKTIIYLGSSVTYGSDSLGVSFVEYIDRLNGTTSVKEAVSGTTLVTKDDACVDPRSQERSSSSGSSYIPRMKTINPDIPADAFICQLSTNDATRHMPLGKISEGFELTDFGTETVAGAIEYIIAYAGKTWHCPVLFYTGTRFDCEEYGEMVKLLLEIQKKWKIGVIDLWNDKALNAISEKDYNLYMSNPIHPTQAGYLLWWTPAMETYLYEFLK